MAWPNTGSSRPDPDAGQRQLPLPQRRNLRNTLQDPPKQEAAASASPKTPRCPRVWSDDPVGQSPGILRDVAARRHRSQVPGWYDSNGHSTRRRRRQQQRRTESTLATREERADDSACETGGSGTRSDTGAGSAYTSIGPSIVPSPASRNTEIPLVQYSRV